MFVRDSCCRGSRRADLEAQKAGKNEEGERRMNVSKNELIEKIESARKLLNASIDKGEDYEEIYRRSVELDGLIEQYIAAGF